MARSSIKVVLNSAGISEMLKDGVFDELIEDHAKKIEQEMKTAIWVNREQNRKEGFPETNNKVFKEPETPHDRSTFQVGVEDASIGDFVFDTVGKAVERAGGKLVKEKKKKKRKSKNNRTKK